MESTPNGSGGQHWRATFADWQGEADRLGLKLQGGELKGPCPSCSGTDRFSVARSGVFQCRGCNPSSGNPEAVRAILGAAFPDSRRGPERQPRTRTAADHRPPAAPGPAQTWPYSTAGGQSVTVHRADGPDGKKVWRTPKGVKGLFLPLYHDQLAAGPLVIAEGETTADAIRAAGFDATTWQGGTAQLEKTDWSGIRDREVTLWPDNDAPGRKAMNRLAGILQSQGCTVRIVQVPDGKPEAWDAADANPAEIPALVDRALEWQPSAEPGPVKVTAADPGGKAEGKDTAATLARRFAESLKAGHLYDPHRGWYYRTEGGRWTPDPSGLTLREVLHGHLGASASTTLTKWVAGELEPLLRIRGTFDDNPEIVGLPDGTAWELRTGKARPVEAGEYISRTLGAVPADGDMPVLSGALTTWFPDQDERNWIWLWLGYCLTGHTREHKFLFAQGPGGGGKSTLLKVIQDVTGGYHCGIPEDSLTSKLPRHDAWKARLAGARVVTVPELADGAWKLGTLKSLVAGDVQTADFKGRDHFDFTPQAKFTIGGNHKPAITDPDSGFTRRLVLAVMEAIPEQDRDPGLPDKLQAELPQITQWALMGAKTYLESGLPPIPAKWQENARAYLSDQDRIGQWFEACAVLDSTGFVRGDELLKSANDGGGLNLRGTTKIYEWIDAQRFNGVSTGVQRRVMVNGQTKPKRGVAGIRLAEVSQVSQVSQDF